MKIAFISDLHLSPDTIANNQLFYSMINTWSNELDALYILGDFFDYWLGDDDDNIFIREIKQSLKNFTQQNKPIYFIAGNHDFVIGHKFARETGITILKDCSILDVNNKKILLSHGDVFCTLDVKYQKMKKILRNPLIMAILLRTPLKWRYKIKESLEKKSSTSFNKSSPETYLVVKDSVAQIAHKYGASIVIHGHTHLPGSYEIESSGGIINRYEIPDWADHNPGGYIMLDDTQIRIHIPTSN